MYTRYSNQIIGKNITLFKGKLICGIRDQLPVFLIINILGAFLFVMWTAFIMFFFLVNQMVYIPIIQYISFLLTGYNYIQCFITEPGIIPRNYYLYAKENSVGFEDRNVFPAKVEKDENKQSMITMNEETMANTDINRISKISVSKVNTNIPRIYTNRYCYTCNIVRPPKASHCHFCDNCVMNFDHHCLFISNCVGVRNQQYFYLFLIFCFVFLLNIFSSSLIHLILILMDTHNGILDKINHNPVVLYISLGLIAISIILLLTSLPNKAVIVLPSFVGFLGLFYLLYFSIPESLPHYINPFSVLLIYISLPCLIFIAPFLWKQTYLVLLGLTTKEYESILLYKSQMLDIENTGANRNRNDENSESGNAHIYEDKIHKLSVKDKIKHLFQFFIREIPTSLV